MFENVFSGMGRVLDNAVFLFVSFPLWLRIVLIILFVISFLFFILKIGFFRTHRIGSGWSGWFSK